MLDYPKALRSTSLGPSSLSRLVGRLNSGFYRRSMLQVSL